MNPNPDPKSPSRLDRAKAKRPKRYEVVPTGDDNYAVKDTRPGGEFVADWMRLRLARRVAAMLNGGGK